MRRNIDDFRNELDEKEQENAGASVPGFDLTQYCDFIVACRKEIHETEYSKAQHGKSSEKDLVDGQENLEFVDQKRDKYAHDSFKDGI